MAIMIESFVQINTERTEYGIDADQVVGYEITKENMSYTEEESKQTYSLTLYIASCSDYIHINDLQIERVNEILCQIADARKAENGTS